MAGTLPTNIEDLGVGGAGLFNDGDTIPIYNFPTSNWNDFTTTNTTYTNFVGGFDRVPFTPAAFPNGPTYVIGFMVAIYSDTSNETASLRLNDGITGTPDTTAAEASVTDTSKTFVTGETPTFDMANASSGTLRAEMKSSSGSATATLDNNMVLYLGISL